MQGGGKAGRLFCPRIDGHETQVVRSCVGLFGREAIRRNIDLLQAVAHQVAGTGNRVVERQGTEAYADGLTFRVGGLGREAS